MKKISTLLVVISISLLGFQGCNDDVTIDDTDSRDFLIKTWRCTEHSDYGGTYDVVVTKDPIYENRILLSNFHELGNETIYATLEGSMLYIPSQTIFDHTVEGEGAIASNQKTIDWDYSVDDGTGVENFTSTFGEVIVTKSTELVAEN